MNIKILKHGLDFDEYASDSPITVKLSDGTEFILKEKFGALVVNSLMENVVMLPHSSNVITIQTEASLRKVSNEETDEYSWECPRKTCTNYDSTHKHNCASSIKYKKPCSRWLERYSTNGGKV